MSLGKSLYGTFPAWWSWQAVLNFNHISIKLQADSNTSASPEAGGGNFQPYVLAPPSLSASQKDKYRDKIKNKKFSSANIDSDCPPPYVTASFGTVTSSMYPFEYKFNVECTQTITVPEGETIKLEFEFMDIEDYQGICYYDWLNVSCREISILWLYNFGTFLF